MFSTYAITDSTGAVADRYACQPCGQVTTYDASYAAPEPTRRMANPPTLGRTQARGLTPRDAAIGRPSGP